MSDRTRAIALERLNNSPRIELHARDGGLVVALDPLADMHIYAMDDLSPDVIIWGFRCFTRVDLYRYEEAFAVAALTGLLRTVPGAKV